MMKQIFLSCILTLLLLSATAQRVTTSFDNDWKFMKGDTIGAEQISFTDASWQKVSVPHDWSIEGPYDRNNKTGRGGGYLQNGIAWYRKQFTVPEEYAKRKIAIEFDGVMANSDVWINGQHLGKRPFGYVSLYYDLTPYLKFGKNSQNIIAVRRIIHFNPHPAGIVAAAFTGTQG